MKINLDLVKRRPYEQKQISGPLRALSVKFVMWINYTRHMRAHTHEQEKKEKKTNPENEGRET